MAAQASSRQTELLTAITASNEATVRRLLNAAKDITLNPPNNSNHNLIPIHLAASINNPRIVEMLVRACANIDIPDQDGRTPLMWAVEKQHLPVVQCLLENGANVQAKDTSGKSALNQALSHNFIDGVLLLLRFGAEEKPEEVVSGLNASFTMAPTPAADIRAWRRPVTDLSHYSSPATGGVAATAPVEPAAAVAPVQPPAGDGQVFSVWGAAGARQPARPIERPVIEEIPRRNADAPVLNVWGRPPPAPADDDTSSSDDERPAQIPQLSLVTPAQEPARTTATAVNIAPEQPNIPAPAYQPPADAAHVRRPVSLAVTPSPAAGAAAGAGAGPTTPVGGEAPPPQYEFIAGSTAATEEALRAVNNTLREYVAEMRQVMDQMRASQEEANARHTQVQARQQAEITAMRRAAATAADQQTALEAQVLELQAQLGRVLTAMRSV